MESFSSRRKRVKRLFFWILKDDFGFVQRTNRCVVETTYRQAYPLCSCVLGIATTTFTNAAKSQSRVPFEHAYWQLYWPVISKCKSIAYIFLQPWNCFPPIYSLIEYATRIRVDSWIRTWCITPNPCWRKYQVSGSRGSGFVWTRFVGEVNTRQSLFFLNFDTVF